MAKCTNCIHYFVCKTLKRKMEVSYAETCVAFLNREDCVAVVRCKDCRWAEDIENPFLRDIFVAGAKNCRVKRGDDAYGVDCSVVSPNDFCSDGERREGE